MDAKWRFGATMFIWIFCFVLAILALIGAANGAIEGWVFFVPLAIAMLATVPIWEGGKDNLPAKSGARFGPTNKTDNTAYTMALLIEMMDEDEREQFKYDLKRRILSGEMVTNESLIEDMEKRKRG